MRGGCSSAATSFRNPHGADFRICPPVTQFRAFRFLGCCGGGYSAPSRLNLSPLVCLGTNPIRSAASSPSHSSDSQELLEPTEDLPQLPDRDDNSNTVCIKIQLQKECRFGEQFFVVGAQPQLGMWNPLDAIPLTWSEGHVWTAQLDIPVGDPVHFKFILRKNNGEFVWQPGQDRVFNTWNSADTISVFQEWEDADAEQIVEEPVVDNKYEESLTLKTEQLKTSGGKCNEEQNLVVETYQDTVTIVAENISHPADPDMDVVRNEGEMSRDQGDFFPSEKPPYLTGSSADMIDEVAKEEILEKKQVPVLVPGLDPFSIMPTENVSAKEEQMKVEPELDQMQDEATTKEHPDGVASSGDEGVVYENQDQDQDQDLESSLYDGQSKKASSCWGDDDNWGLKRFFNHLGFL